MVTSQTVLEWTLKFFAKNISHPILNTITYFLGGTCPTLTLTQMTLRVCIPVVHDVLSCPEGVARVELSMVTEVSSMHSPQGPVCQW